MRNLKKNETKLWYSNYGKGNPILDENGDETGDYDSGYGSPVSFFTTLSASKGNAYADVFGTNLDYTRTLRVSRSYSVPEWTHLDLKKQLH